MGREYEEWGDAVVSVSLTRKGEMYSTTVPGAWALIFHPRIVTEEGNLCFHCWFEAGQLARCAL